MLNAIHLPLSGNIGTIVIKSPERPAGQESVIGLTVPKMNVVRVGFVGLGMRGPGAVERFTHIAGTKIVALCDYEKERAENCQKYLQKACLPEAAVYSGAEGYTELCDREDKKLVKKKKKKKKKQKKTKHSANAKTLTWYTLQPTGITTSRLPSMPWSMERT